MHPYADKTREAIHLIRDTQSKVAELLSDTPDFKTRATHVFETLGNGLAFAIGDEVITSESTSRTRAEQQPAHRTVMGIPVPEPSAPMAERVAGAQPTQSELQKLRSDVDRAYGQFQTLSNKEIRNTLSDLEIRGVAKRAGLLVTKTEPAHITDSFVTEIKRAIEEKAAADAATAEAEQKTADLKENATPAGPEAPAPETPAAADAATAEAATTPAAETPKTAQAPKKNK